MPLEYRAFLLHVGNGGASPQSRLYTLKEVQVYGPETWSLPCPLEPNGAFGSDSAAWAEDAGTFAFAANSGVDSSLVMNGPFRGRVVYVPFVSGAPSWLVPDAGFLDGYERWLDRVLAGLSVQMFGYLPLGTK